MKRAKTWDSSKLRQAFRDSGTRFTAQREAVWKLFAGSPGGFTIAQAVEKLKPRGIGPATVYRTVSLLESTHFLRRIHDKELEHRFVATRPGHSHPLVCTSCGQVTEFESCGLSVLERLLTAETGFRVEGHYLEVYGTCASCKERHK